MKQRIDERAFEFAKKAHEGQFRKYTGEPYIEHCTDVCNILFKAAYPSAGSSYPLTHRMRELRAICYLHDVVEDCGVTYKELEEAFNKNVAEGVYWLTDDIPKEHGNRATRKMVIRWKLKRAPALIRNIKYADAISNAKSIVEHDPNFAKVYLREMNDFMLEVHPASYKLRNELRIILEQHRNVWQT